MAQEKNYVARIVIPLVVLIGGIGIAFAVFRNTNNQGPKAAVAQNTPTAPAGQTPAAPPVAATPPGAGGETKPADAKPDQPPTVNPPAPTPDPAALTKLEGLTAKVDTAAAAPFTPLGSLKPAKEGNTFKMRVEFSPNGAGIANLQLADDFVSVHPGAPNQTVQKTETYDAPVYDQTGAVVGTRTRVIVPMALLGVVIEGQFINLSASASGSIWKELAPGAFEAGIVDKDGSTIGRVERRYILEPGRYDLTVRQRFENLSGRPLSVVWQQIGPIDIDAPAITPGANSHRYGGDVRRVRLGYIGGVKADPNRQYVDAAEFLLPHTSVLGEPADPFANTWTGKPLWPEPRGQAEGFDLSWGAMTNRYFAAAVFPLLEPGKVAAGQTVDKSFGLIGKAGSLEPVVLARGGADAELKDRAVLGLLIKGKPETVAAGASMDAGMGFYAGPLTRKVLDAEPAMKALNLGGLVLYTFGGPCAFCTFQPITHLLHGFLGVLHDYILFDYSLAIMLLVVCVRTLLHPVMCWSQMSIQRFGKQMQSLAPKQKKLQEKFKDDPKRLREEIGKLMREENVNYAGMLGCLPMFLQTPVWIALYAMLFFTFELRHHPAFFGVFQTLSGGKWLFMADLAEADHFIPLGTSINIPLLGALMGPIEAVNIVPLILGVVFYIQQKYMSPPLSAEATPEQITQQKMMKWMAVIMFPVFMYNAPSGLSLYFLVNSTLGIFESRHIRAQVEKQDAEAKARGPRNPLPKKPGFFARLQAQIEARRKLVEEMNRLKKSGRQPPQKGGGGGTQPWKKK